MNKHENKFGFGDTEEIVGGVGRSPLIRLSKWIRPDESAYPEKLDRDRVFNQQTQNQLDMPNP